MSLHGESMNILRANNKIEAFKKKLQHWAGLLESGKMDMFSDLNDFPEENELVKTLRNNPSLTIFKILHNGLINIFPKTPIRKNTIGYYHP